MKKLTIAFFVELLWRIKHLSIWPYKVWEVPIYHSVTLAALADGYGTMTLSPGKVEKKRLHGRYFTEARARKEIENWNQRNLAVDVTLISIENNNRTFVTEVHYT